MKKTLIALAMSFVSLFSWAYDFEYKGIYYTVTDDNARTCMTRSAYRRPDLNSIGNTANGRLELPETVYDGDTPYTLTAIGDYGFYRQNITSLVLPSTIVEIKQYAFSQCTRLSSITIPPSVKKIDLCAFSFDSSVERINITDLAAWCEIEFGSFDASPFMDSGETCFLYLNGDKLSGKLTIPEGTTSIGNYALSHYKCITSLSIPSTVESIGFEAISSCDNLTDITINAESLQTIGERAFYNVSHVTVNISSLYDWCKVYGSDSDNLPSWMESIHFIKDNITLNSYDWYNPTVYIPEGVCSIGSYAFKGMTLSGGIVLPQTLQTIGKSAFDDIGSPNSGFGLIIPNSVTEIGDYAFSGCHNISSVVLGKSVTTIGKSAFSYCSKLSSLYIPSSVTTIGDKAFEYTKYLTSITYDTNEPIKFDGFDSEVYSRATLYVPVGATDAMRKVYPWKSFLNIEETQASILKVNFASSCGYVIYNDTMLSSQTNLNVDASMSFIIIPKNGYCIDAIYLNGEDKFTGQRKNNFYYFNVYSYNLVNVLDIRFRELGEATLTVSSPGHHTVTHTYPEGSNPTITLEPQDGWLLHSVTLNDEPVELNDENKISISAISGHNNLNAIYIEDTTDIDAVELGEAAPVTVTLSDHILTVSNKPAEASVLVYDIKGNLVVSTTDSELYMPMSNEVAIIKVADKVYKAAVR